MGFIVFEPITIGGAAPFLAQYRAVREQDGYREIAPDYYRMLRSWRKTIRARRNGVSAAKATLICSDRALPDVWQGRSRD